MKTVVFFGDSVTEGCFELYKTSYGFDTVRDPDSGYVAKMKARLASRYGENAIRVVNAGVSGNTATMGLARIEEDVLSHKPDVVVVNFALNDSLGELARYEAKMTAIFDTLLAAGARVVLLTPNAMCTGIDEKTPACGMKVAKKIVEVQNSGKLDLFVKTAERLAAERRIPVADAYRRWKDRIDRGENILPLLANRINHPTREMHEVFAEELMKVLPDLLDRIGEKTDV